MIFKYSVEDDETIYEYDVDNPYDDFCQYAVDYILEEVAQDYYNDHDGYEDKWPLTFKLFDKDNKLLGTAKINVEYEPTFYTIFKKEKNK
jgi:hypothetical protein